MATISRNSEILFLYDAKMCNPNGDMDNENRPRMDWDTNTNLVSDVRLKRYLRDYFETKLKKEIFITSKAKDAKQRNEQIKKKWMNMIDCRIFGVVPASGEKGSTAEHFTGPVQFNWGYSLNPVELCNSSTITSSFSSGEGVGKDYRVNYSFIAFSGSINALIAKKNAEITKTEWMTEDDLLLFDKAMINAIPFCRTRSKIGQAPRLYLRVQMNNNKTLLKDLREFINIDYSVDEFKVRNIDQITLKIEHLINYMKKFKDKIDKILYWKDNNLEIEEWDKFLKEFSTVEINTDE